MAWTIARVRINPIGDNIILGEIYDEKNSSDSWGVVSLTSWSMPGENALPSLTKQNISIIANIYNMIANAHEENNRNRDGKRVRKQHNM
jgi:hypothetical protein